MISTLKEVRAALEDLKRQYGEHPDAFLDWTKARAAITKLDALIAEQEKAEPVATVAEVHMSRYTIEWTNGPLPEGTKLYTLIAQEKAEPVAQTHRTTGWVAPVDRYNVPVLFNPYTGEPRDVRDVQSDPQGILIAPLGKVEMLAAAPQSAAEPLTDEQIELLVADIAEWSFHVEVDTAPTTLTKHVEKVLAAHKIGAKP